MHYKLPKEAIETYNNSLYVYKLFFTKARWVIYNDFDIPKNLSKVADIEYIGYDIEEIKRDLEKLASQYNEAKMPLFPLDLIVVAKKDAKVVIALPIEVVS